MVCHDCAPSLDVVGESEIFTEEMVPLLTRSSIYNDLIRKSALLANTDLTLLDTVEDRLCFYGNLYNLMRIHGCIHQAEYIAKLKVSGTHTKSFVFNPILSLILELAILNPPLNILFFESIILQLLISVASDFDPKYQYD